MSNRQPASRHLFRKSLALFLSLSIAAGVPATSLAQGTSYGSGGSITTRFIDVKTGEEVRYENLKPGQQVRIVPQAYNAAGQSIPCEGAQFAAIQGVSGDQLRLDGNVLSMGRNFGSAEFTVKCRNLPDVQYKHAMYNRPPLGQQARQEAQQQPPAEASSGSGSGALLGLGVGAVVLGGVGIAAALASASGGGGGGGSSAPAACQSGLFCRTAAGKEGCCPSGAFMQLCQNSNTCVNVEPFTNNRCPGEERRLNCCPGPVDCGINRR